MCNCDCDIDSYDWFRGFNSRCFAAKFCRDFEEAEREFEDAFKEIETKAPRDLVREYETPGGGKVKKFGPFVYGYSMTIGPDGKPNVREFGNVKSASRSGGSFFQDAHDLN